MKKPKDYIDCPICGEKIKSAFTSVDNEITQDWWIYKCQDCNVGFTTTESDTISMEIE